MTVVWQAVAVVALLAATASLAWALALRRRMDEPDASDGEPSPALAEERKRRRKAEDAAAGALRDRDRILDTLADAFFHLDVRGRFTFLNRSARQLLEKLGKVPEELLERRIWDVFPTPPEQPGRRAISGALEDRESRSVEVRSDSMDAWLEIRAFPAGDGGASVYVRDVTERKEAEIDLRESRERFRTLVEHATEAVVVLDAETEEVVQFNQNALELFQRTPEELRGAAPFQFSPPVQPDGRRSVEAAREHIRRALDGESPVAEWVHLTGDGRTLDTEVRLVRLPARDRMLIRGSITDITERKRAERALRESEERYRALFEEDVAGNFVTEVGGRLVACNSAFARMFGFESVEQAVGTDVTELYPSPREREELLDELRAAGSIQYREVEARRIDGSPVHLVENARAVFDEDGGMVELRGHLIDVTRQKELRDQLRRAQKLEAVGRLAGGIAHDFNNLLTTVTGHADLLLMRDDLHPAVKEDVRKIRRAADRASRLTNQLLAFSRRQVLEAEAMDLNRVVDEVTEMLERVIGEDVAMRVETAEDLPPVEADPSQLEQVVMNLAVNARDAMPDGGELVLATGSRTVSRDGDGPEGHADGTLDPGRYAYVEVRDSGEGIPEEVRDKIFEPFFTTKEPEKGTGLGLAMVYGIVTQSGGHVTVESEVGSGTSFRVYLPATPTGRGEETGGAAMQPTVLVHQDDPVVRKLLMRILRREGYRVLGAESTDEAAALLREWSGEIHLLITDDPDHDGAPLPPVVERTRSGCRILRIASGPAEGAAAAERAPAPDLRTPFTPGELIRKVRSTLGPGPTPGRVIPGSDG